VLPNPIAVLIVFKCMLGNEIPDVLHVVSCDIFLLAGSPFVGELMKMMRFFRDEDLFFNHVNSYQPLPSTFFTIQAGSRRIGKTAITPAIYPFNS